MGAPSGIFSQRPPLWHCPATKTLPREPSIFRITKPSSSVQAMAKPTFNNVHHAIFFFQYKKNPRCTEVVLRCNRMCLGNGAFNHALVCLLLPEKYH